MMEFKDEMKMQMEIDSYVCLAIKCDLQLEILRMKRDSLENYDLDQEKINQLCFKMNQSNEKILADYKKKNKAKIVPKKRGLNILDVN